MSFYKVKGRVDLILENGYNKHVHDSKKSLLLQCLTKTSDFVNHFWALLLAGLLLRFTFNTKIINFLKFWMVDFEQN